MVRVVALLASAWTLGLVSLLDPLDFGHREGPAPDLAFNRANGLDLGASREAARQLPQLLLRPAPYRLDGEAPAAKHAIPVKAEAPAAPPEQDKLTAAVARAAPRSP